MEANENIEKLHHNIDPEVKPHRKAEHAIDPIFLNRWSPRAFSSEEIPEEIVMSVLEAGRWAASSYNEQPWRYIIARTPEDRKKFLSFLVPANQAWAHSAPVLIVIVSKKTFTQNGKENSVYKFDAGTSSGYLSLQATLNGLYMHGMSGFDADLARATLGIPTDFDAIAVFALGKRGHTDQLPEGYRGGEVPSARRPLSETVMEGHFRDSTEKVADEGTLETAEDQSS
jgi:nitroreductase